MSADTFLVMAADGWPTPTARIHLQGCDCSTVRNGHHEVVGSHMSVAAARFLAGQFKESVAIDCTLGSSLHRRDQGGYTLKASDR